MGGWSIVNGAICDLCEDFTFPTHHFLWISMSGVQMDSPWNVPPAYVVRNTFVEIDEHGEQKIEEPSVPAFRRRRGSSFFRNSSEPLTAGGRSGRRTSRGRGRTACDEVPCDLSTADEETDPGLSTPEISPAASRATSPAPGS